MTQHGAPLLGDRDARREHGSDARVATADALCRAIAGGPAALRRFQAQELRERAARLIRDAEAMEAEAASMDPPAPYREPTGLEYRGG